LIFKPFEQDALYKVILKLTKIPNHKKNRFFSDEVDKASLDSLYGGDQDHIMLMMKLFLKNTPPALRQMKIAMERGDFETLERVLHKMKPSFAMVGLEQVTKEAYLFENKLTQSKKTPTLSREFKKLSRSIEKAIKVISFEQKKFLMAKI